ncbi:two-component hybrid sensor and regulator [Crocosphaera subtropica ATCC 51142]|uniref:Two-component hybrid sensor and regulator n=1 Tax=Crocosphaera subtropica (strain ATCC 51142 / BH68) TaxID=43989 RepID=B1WRK4_CROS5|nr:response regulator [Crocosphaera subtropica]ACB51853.1 two-component hybrid sensor and regulator [Crocosphaera subtropica ATCC 51142]
MDWAFPSHTTPYSGHQSPLILGVDGNEDNLLLLTYIIRRMGCTLMTANNGNCVFSLVRDYQPSLILLDIILPGLSGIEVIKQLKKDQTTKNIPIIAVTGFVHPQKRDYLLEIGCQDCIIKPYLLEEVEIMVSRFVTQHYSLALAQKCR